MTMGKGKRGRDTRKQETAMFSLSPTQRKAMMAEINRQILEQDKKYKLDMDAAVLWVLHESFGFGEKRLKRFFNAFSEKHEELRNYYELEGDANTWLCRYLLKRDAGVDIEAWEKEERK